MGKLSKSKEPTERDGVVSKSDKWNSRIGVEEHRKNKADIEVKHNLFELLKKFNMLNKNTLFQLSVEVVMSRHDMSGEVWDD